MSAQNYECGVDELVKTVMACPFIFTTIAGD